jgi:peptide chain release factor 2
MTDELNYEFYREGELTAEELDEQYSSIANHIEAIEFKNMLSDEGDSLSAVLQITAGAGGTESCD